MNHSKIDLRYRRLNGGAQLGDGRTLKAIGLWPHWGTAIALKVKRIETRGRMMGHTGPIAIYQTKNYPKGEVHPMYEDLVRDCPERQVWDDVSTYKPWGIPHPANCPRAAIVAIVRAVTCVKVPYVDNGGGIKGTITVSFWNGDGTEETRTVPPPVGTAERELGAYAGDEDEPRYAWILTDIMPLSQPVPVPKPEPGENRQGIFTLRDDLALPLLQQYRDFCLNLRPHCRHCGSPLGDDEGVREGGVCKWTFSTSEGWRHVCPKWGKESMPFRSAFDDGPCASRAFLPGGFPRVPSGSLDKVFQMEKEQHPERYAEPVTLTMDL